jgi:hypothetical protein
LVDPEFTRLGAALRLGFEICFPFTFHWADDFAMVLSAMVPAERQHLRTLHRTWESLDIDWYRESESTATWPKPLDQLNTELAPSNLHPDRFEDDRVRLWLQAGRCLGQLVRRLRDQHGPGSLASAPGHTSDKLVLAAQAACDQALEASRMLHAIALFRTLCQELPGFVSALAGAFSPTTQGLPPSQYQVQRAVAALAKPGASAPVPDQGTTPSPGIELARLRVDTNDQWTYRNLIPIAVDHEIRSAWWRSLNAVSVPDAAETSTAARNRRAYEVLEHDAQATEQVVSAFRAECKRNGWRVEVNAVNLRRWAGEHAEARLLPPPRGRGGRPRRPDYRRPAE